MFHSFVQNDNTVSQCLYSLELELKESTKSWIVVSYSDLLTHIDGTLTFKLFNKRDDISFPRVTFPHLISNITVKPPCGIYVSTLIWYLHPCTYYKLSWCIQKLVSQGYQKKLNIVFQIVALNIMLGTNRMLYLILWIYKEYIRTVNSITSPHSSLTPSEVIPTLTRVSRFVFDVCLHLHLVLCQHLCVLVWLLVSLVVCLHLYVPVSRHVILLSHVDYLTFHILHHIHLIQQFQLVSSVRFLVSGRFKWKPINQCIFATDYSTSFLHGDIESPIMEILKQFPEHKRESDDVKHITILLMRDERDSLSF